MKTSLSLFRQLITAGPNGHAVGYLVEHTQQNFSTISAQLLVLANAQLVDKRRVGRSIVYSANFATMQNLLGFLMRDCCQGNIDTINPVIAKSSAVGTPDKGTI